MTHSPSVALSSWEVIIFVTLMLNSTPHILATVIQRSLSICDSWESAWRTSHLLHICWLDLLQALGLNATATPVLHSCICKYFYFRGNQMNRNTLATTYNRVGRVSALCASSEGQICSASVFAYICLLKGKSCEFKQCCIFSIDPCKSECLFLEFQVTKKDC